MKRGQVLLLVFLIVLIIGILGIGLLHMSDMESIQLRRQIHYLQALNIAEAGIERALWKMVSTPGWKEGYNNEPLGNGYYTLMIEELPEPNRYKIISTGKVGYGFGSVTKTIYLDVKVGNKWPSAFNYVLFWGNPSYPQSSGPLNIRNNVSIKGNVFVYGHLHLSNNASVTQGYVYATDGVSGGNNAYYQEGELPEPLPERVNFNTSYYEELINEAYNSGISGFELKNNQTYSLNGSTLYVKGNVKLGNNVTIYGPGTIVATGNIEAGNNVNFTQNINLIAGGNITLRNNLKYQTNGNIIYGRTGITIRNNCEIGKNVVIYTPGKLTVENNSSGLQGIFCGGVVELSNNVYIKGAVYGDNFRDNEIKNNVVIEYDPTVFNFEPPSLIPTEKGVIKIRWSEDNF